MKTTQWTTWCLALGLGLLGCGGDDDDTAGDDDDAAIAQTLYVAHAGSLVSYDIATGDERPGAVQDVATPVDLQALADGTLLVNLTNSGEILIVDGKTMLEEGRPHSSSGTGLRPVHSYLSPERAGKQYWLALNDGSEGERATNSACFVDVNADSATYLQVMGEVGVGIGHHKAAFSNTLERVVISDIADCDDVLTVYDYSDITAITALRTISSAELGWDGSSYPRNCDPTYETGMPPAPHGCATSKVSGKAYCNLTSSGEIVAIAIDATPPTFTVLATHGSGGGYTKAHLDGRYVYTLQEGPREGAGGAACQIGQLVVIDASTDTIAAEVPLFYEGPGCTRSLLGTDEETAGAGHIQIALDGDTMYLTLAGGFGVETARTRQELVVDVSNPGAPVQLASLPVGTSSGHHGDALSGDGRWLFVTNTVDGTVTQIDTASNTVAQTITVEAEPLAVTTWGSAEGPSVQTGPIH